MDPTSSGAGGPDWPTRVDGYAAAEDPLAVAAGLPGGDPVLFALGDIGISATTVFVPGRAFPLRGSTFVVRDHSSTSSATPSYAVILAVVGFFFVCVLSLLFLLIKETTTRGHVEIEVRNGDRYHLAQVPVYAPGQVVHLRQMVDHARYLAG